MQIPNEEFAKTNYRCLYRLTYTPLISGINWDLKLEEFKKDIYVLVNDIAYSYSYLMIEYADVVCPFQEKDKFALIDCIEIVIFKNEIDKYCIDIEHKPCFNSIDNLLETKERRLEEFMLKLSTIITEYRNSRIVDIISKHKELIIIGMSEPKIMIDFILYIENEYIQKMIENTKKYKKYTRAKII